MKYTSSNPPTICMMTNSTCYKQTSTMSIKGVLWHSTGANNPNLKRYVQPSSNDANYTALMNLLGKNSYGNDWNHISHEAGVNAWIGLTQSGQVTTVQTLPWNYKPRGCGGGCNNGWIQFEICEDGLTDKAYFNKVYKEACELTAYLCKKYGIDPKGTVSYNGKTVPTILCHWDSYKLGLGSSHYDVYNWFDKQGKTMNDVRNDVAALMSGSGSTTTQPTSPAPSGSSTFKVGDEISLVSGATYTSGKSIPSWVFTSKLYVRDIRANGDIVFSTQKTGDVTGVVKASFVKSKTTTAAPTTFSSYLVKITTDVLNVRSGPSTSYKINTTVKNGDVYTIVGESGGWGKLKSGAGWICLDYTKRL